MTSPQHHTTHRRRAERGYTLILVMALLSAVGVGAIVAFERVGAAHVDEREVQRRAQLLWLARSAALNARPGERVVLIAGERVLVRVTADGASAVRAVRAGRENATATVTTAGGEWIERYTAAAP